MGGAPPPGGQAEPNPSAPRPGRIANLRRAAWTAAIAGALLWGYYLWQPYRFDAFPRTPPSPNPWTDPDSPRLFSAGIRVAIVTAHPDDAEFYIGGTLSRLHERGADTTLIVATDGDKAYIPWADHAALRRVRRAEAEAAARRWGARQVVFLGHEDSRLALTPELVQEIAGQLGRLRPEYVLLFDGDYPPRFSHRDHRVVGIAAEEAVKRAGVGKWLMRFSTAAPNYALDVTALWTAKLQLLHVHASQFGGAHAARIDHLIAGYAASAGRLLHVPFAEAFRCARRP